MWGELAILSDAQIFGKIVLDRRKQVRLTQENLAHAALGNLHRKGYISLIENGAIPNPTKRNIKLIAEALRIDEDEVPTSFRWTPPSEIGPTTKAIAEETLAELKSIQSTLISKVGTNADFGKLISTQIEAGHRALDQKLQSLERRLVEKMGSADHDIASLPLLDKGNHSEPSQKMSQLRERLSILELKKIVRCAESVNVARQLIGTKITCSIDASELIHYAESPFNDRAEDAFTIFALTASNVDRLILGRTPYELREYLSYLAQNGLNRLSSGDFTRAPNHKLMPLGRVTNAVSRLKLSQPTGSGMPELRKEFALAVHTLQRIRSQSMGCGSAERYMHRDHSMAEQIVAVMLLNHETENEGAILHTSGSQLLKQAEDELRRQHGFFRPRNHRLVVDPSVVTYRHFMLNRSFDVSRLSFLMDVEYYARTWVRRLGQIDLREVQMTRREMDDAVVVVDALKIAIQPIAKEVLEVQLSDLQKPLRPEVSSEPKDIEAVCHSFSSSMTDILRYLSPLDEAMIPFRC